MTEEPSAVSSKPEVRKAPDERMCPKCNSGDLLHGMEHSPGDPWTTTCRSCKHVWDMAAEPAGGGGNEQ